MKKFILSIVFIIGSFIILNQNVNAEVYTGTISPDSLLIARDSYSGYFTPSISIPNKQGYLMFTFMYGPAYGNTNEMRGLNEVWLIDGVNDKYVCSYGSITQYIDTSKMLNSVSVVCPIRTSVGISRIYLGFNRDNGQDQGVAVDMSDHISFVEDLTNPQDIISAINSMSSINALYIEHWGSTLWDKLQSSTDRVVAQQEIIESLLGAMQTAQVNAINQQTQQAHQDAQQAHQDAQDINNSINNNNIDSANSSATTWDSKNASNGVITQLLTLPISLLQAIVNGIQTTCSTFNLGTLWGTSLEMPCIDLSSLIGSILFNIIDLLFSGFMIFAISKKLIKIFNDFTNLKSNQIDELYGGGN